MAGFDERLKKILDGYASFVREKELALPKRQPYLVRWVKDFLLFAKEHGGYTFEQTLDLFLAEVGGRVGTKPWQLQQAADAIRIYRYQYRGAQDHGEGGSPVGGLKDEAAILARRRPAAGTRGCLRGAARLRGQPVRAGAGRGALVQRDGGRRPVLFRQPADRGAEGHR